MTKELKHLHIANEQLKLNLYTSPANSCSLTLSLLPPIGDGSQFPLLVGHMIQRTESEGVGGSGHWTFREVLDKLLTIVVLPVRQALTHVSGDVDV